MLQRTAGEGGRRKGEQACTHASVEVPLVPQTSSQMSLFYLVLGPNGLLQMLCGLFGWPHFWSSHRTFIVKDEVHMLESGQCRCRTCTQRISVSTQMCSDVWLKGGKSNLIIYYLCWFTSSLKCVLAAWLVPAEYLQHMACMHRVCLHHKNERVSCYHW